MGILLPLSRFFYKPSSQYSTIKRRSVIDFLVNNDTLMILACIHKEDNLPGLMRLLRVSQSTAETPVSVIALQLFQLTGRCAMPIMAPLHEVSNISTFSTNIDRCNLIVNSFLSLERENGGRTRAQHYVATSPYSTMHNDICNISHENKVGLIILPFHICWDIDGTIIDSSMYIREVNNMVLDKAPCSVGILVDRRSKSKHVIDEEVYLISIIFLGGADDYEALAYANVCANLPNVRLDVVWLKSPVGKKENKLDYEVLKKFCRSCMKNERITFKEVVVCNGAETIQVVMTIKDQVDLLITGKHHNLNFIPMLGLSKGWSEYPELGILGDMLACPDFRFSLLIVQQEPRVDYSLDLQINDVDNVNL